MNEIYEYWTNVLKKEAGIFIFSKRFNVVEGREGNVLVVYQGIEHIMGRENSSYYMHNPDCEARMGLLKHISGSSLDVKISEIFFNGTKFGGVLISGIKDLPSQRMLFGRINSSLRNG